MLLTITTTSTDLGYLLHKHPDRAQSFELPHGTAHVFYPEASPERCTAALLLEIDPIGLVRGRRTSGAAAPGADGFSLAQYVNDRPYAASSMMAVALGKVFRTALAGRCDARPGLADRTLPLRIHVPALPCRGGAGVAERVFAPLGWSVRAEPVPLDEELGWGDSRYVDLTLDGELRLADALNQLYVLLPVLDDAKHYWVSPDEVDKLVRAGSGWLAGHPERELITARYLRHQRRLVTSAAERLDEPDGLDESERTDDELMEDGGAPADESPASLAVMRREAVLAAVRGTGARSVVDLGCGEGRLLTGLLAEPSYERVLGTDVSARSLEIAARRLHLDTMPERARARIELRQSSLTYRDATVAGFDTAVLMEVIEHVDPPRLAALERSVFGWARPGSVIVTTPNAEYNVRYEMPEGTMRHSDHRFEWDRAQFRTWAGAVAETHGYPVEFRSVGIEDDEVGPPTQMAVFTRSRT